MFNTNTKMSLKTPFSTKHGEEGSVALPLQGVHLSLPHLLRSTQISKKHLIYSCGLVFGGLLVSYATFFFLPKSIMYSPSATTACFAQPTLLPQLTKPASSGGFMMQQKSSLSIGPLDLYSHQTCVTPTTAPRTATTETLQLKPFGLGFLGKKVSVKTEGAPKTLLKTDTSKTLSTTSNITFSLSTEDVTFAYSLASASASSACETVQSTVVCPLEPLALAQGSEHALSFQRQYKNTSPEIISEHIVKTLEPVRITATSITQGKKVYEQPVGLTISTTKPLKSVVGQKLSFQSGQETILIDTTAAVSDTTIVLTFSKLLPRNTTFTLVIESAIAEDGSALEEPFILSFLTSGGPAVSGTNIGSYKASTTQAIAVTFDTMLSSAQPLSNFISLRSGNTIIDTTIRLSGNTVTLQPKTPLAACTDIKLVVLAGLTSAYDVSGGVAWEYASRTICQKSYTIGTSVQGRSIPAYSFGTGASTVIFVGGTHGDEKSSTYILNSFIEDLEKNYRTIPAGKTVIVIPNLNPDGFAASSRLNANGIDLNRNFPADNWQTDVYIPGNVFKPGGGGSAPLSEPESSALASLILQKQPRLVLTYHAVARLVISNDAGDSYALAQLYASKSGFGALMNSASHGAFEYDSTGEFEDWLHDKQNIPALLVELATTNQNEYSTHTQAMWSMLQ